MNVEVLRRAILDAPTPSAIQDILVRRYRQKGEAALWLPGTDHAGIATQAVVEKRLKEIEGKTRHDIGREALVERIHDWAGQSKQRIVSQQQGMGCSCDWDRARFTMDPVCARAVRHTFFKMFRDGLIFRGNRLVNWDCALQTAVADDELYKESVAGKFHYFRYPIAGATGGPTHVAIATTRPETMLGDTAVAVHPDPKGALQAAIGHDLEWHVDLALRARSFVSHPHLQAIPTNRECAGQFQHLGEKEVPSLVTRKIRYPRCGLLPGQHAICIVIQS